MPIAPGKPWLHTNDIDIIGIVGHFAFLQTLRLPAAGLMTIAFLGLLG